MDMPPKRTSRSHILGILLFLVLLIVILFFISKEMENLQNFILRSGFTGMLVSLGLYGLLGLSPIPSEPLTVLLSTVYGPLLAALVAGAGNLIAAVIEYALGSRISAIASFEERKKALPLGLGNLPVNSVPFLLIARMLPGYGPKFVSVLSGVYRVPMWRYLWTAAIPTFIGALIFAFGGLELINLFLENKSIAGF